MASVLGSSLMPLFFKTVETTCLMASSGDRCRWLTFDDTSGYAPFGNWLTDVLHELLSLLVAVFSSWSLANAESVTLGEKTSKFVAR